MSRAAFGGGNKKIGEVRFSPISWYLFQTF